MLIWSCVKCRRSNIDEDGVWLFRVGDLRGENVHDPGAEAPDAGDIYAIYYLWLAAWSSS